MLPQPLLAPQSLRPLPDRPPPQRTISQVCKVYFGLLEMLCQSQAKLLASRDTASFAFFVSSLDAGLKSLDVAVSSQSAAAVDNLAACYFNHGPGSASPDATGQVGRLLLHFF